ncbi:hypothetical protein HPB49_010120 [Dermacentor silvarum]|uniref:Uncharacterized protein n=1 Tax=Dermacentor silvarum TaxID=543639 RepID=A0ACB8CWQ3_DERSI|nr:hypothetical protein HPB49_010120 [Dermacentor silvarum]
MASGSSVMTSGIGDVMDDNEGDANDADEGGHGTGSGRSSTGQKRAGTHPGPGQTTTSTSAEKPLPPGSLLCTLRDNSMRFNFVFPPDGLCTILMFDSVYTTSGNKLAPPFTKEFQMFLDKAKLSLKTQYGIGIDQLCGSSSSKTAAENQRFSNRGSESSPQPPPYHSQASGSKSMLASSAIHSEPGSKASKTVDEAASAAASATEACGDDAADVKYCDPFDTGPAAVALRLLRAEEQRNQRSPPAHATPAAGRAPSADEMVHSPVLLLPGLKQQPRAGHLHPVLSSSSSSGVSVVTGRREGITGQPSLRHACCPGPPPHQGSGGSTSASSGVQQRPAPVPRWFQQPWWWCQWVPVYVLGQCVVVLVCGQSRQT